ncbi:MAG: hypothetical protein U9Q89_06005 [Thermodesulfobacteriota bacterium]|nr:hypothetical protein [Thermodesulfobacteriota bacterium]
MASQLHELLAVEGDLKGEKNKVKEESVVVFSKKPNLFLGAIRLLEMFDESRKEEEAAGTERQEITTTVPAKLRYLSSAFVRFWDAKLQKEAANQEASADIMIDGVTFAKDVPVTFLLGMEDELKQLRTVYDGIPTLQPGIEWIKDPQKGPGYWKALHPLSKHKTEKTVQSKIIVPATKEHPAQIREWTEDVPVGRYTTENWSGMISPAEKSSILSKLDAILRACKKARQRANNQEVKKIAIGKQIFDFIHTDLAQT